MSALLANMGLFVKVVQNVSLFLLTGAAWSPYTRFRADSERSPCIAPLSIPRLVCTRDRSRGLASVESRIRRSMRDTLRVMSVSGEHGHDYVEPERPHRPQTTEEAP